MNILVVDDDQIIRSMLERFFKHEGFGVSTACDGLTALNLVKSEKFDIIFMDVRMPQMDGLEATREIKKINPEQKIVMMTGYTEEEIYHKAQKEGILAFLYKPFDIEEVIDLVKCVDKK